MVVCVLPYWAGRFLDNWSKRVMLSQIEPMKKVARMALRMFEDGSLPVRQAAWYRKRDTTFSDDLAFVRRDIWAGMYFVNSKTGSDRLELSCHDWDALLDQLVAAA